MKSFASLLVLLAAAVAGCSTTSRTEFSPSAVAGETQSPGFEPGGATVRSVHGEVQYGTGGAWDRLRVNMVLTNGVQVRTGHDAETYLSLGRSATVKLTADSELDLEAMMVRRRIFAQATRSAQELRKGAMLGSVKELSPESVFQIRSGGVTVEVRSADFSMEVGGNVVAVTGLVTVRAGGKTYQLRTGEYFDSKKNQVVRRSDGWVPDHPVDPSRLQPGSSSLSPFDRGLENARHGGY